MEPHLRLHPDQQTLTPEQEAEARHFVEARILAQLSTEPVDEQAAEALLQHVYQANGQPPPQQIAWLDGPLQLVQVLLPEANNRRVRFNYYRLYSRVRNIAWSSLWTSVWYGIMERIGRDVQINVWDKVNLCVYRSLGFSTQVSVPTSARDSVEVSLQQIWMRVGVREHIPLSFTTSLWEVVRRYLEEIAIWKAVRDVVGKRMWKHVGAKVDRRVWKRVEASVRERLQDSVQLSVEASAGASARFRVEASVWDRLEASIRESVEASVRESVEASRWDRVWSGVWDQVWRRVRDRVLEGLPLLRDRLWDREHASVKSYESAEQLACFLFFDEYLAPNALGALARFNELVSGYWLEHERAFVVRRPTVLARDAAGRLHSATGKCMQYPDGWGFYAWHGVWVPEKVILTPEVLTREDFLNEADVEVRRVIQERMGERFVPELGGSVIDTGPRGTLYEVALPDDPERVARYVEVQDVSTPRRYFLRVPPTIQTTAEAVAWSFGLSVQEYQPRQET